MAFGYITTIRVGLINARNGKKESWNIPCTLTKIIKKPNGFMPMAKKKFIKPAIVAIKLCCFMH